MRKNQKHERKYQSYVMAACILVLFLNQSDLKGFGGFCLHDGSLHPVIRKHKWTELSPSEKQERECQIRDSFLIGSYTAFGLLNNKELLDNMLAKNPDNHKASRIMTLLNLCQIKYRNFVNRVMSHWYNKQVILDVDIKHYFLEDGGSIN